MTNIFTAKRINMFTAKTLRFTDKQCEIDQHEATRWRAGIFEMGLPKTISTLTARLRRLFHRSRDSGLYADVSFELLAATPIPTVFHARSRDAVSDTGKCYIGEEEDLEASQ
uniref:Uncharacterized protein n=1 Tax=Onchocerca volvulus TaxID=6282 RepID=A0A8R1TR67_ONCVO